MVSANEQMRGGLGKTWRGNEVRRQTEEAQQWRGRREKTSGKVEEEREEKIKKERRQKSRVRRR